MRPYIGLVLISGEVAEKLGSKHGLNEQDVRDAVQAPARTRKARWLADPTDPRGPRLLVVGTTQGDRTLKVVLYPVEGDPETWRLGTAVPEGH